MHDRKREDVIWLEQGDCSSVAEDVDAQPPVRVRQVNLAVDGTREMTHNLVGMERRPAVLVGAQASGLVCLDPGEQVRDDRRAYRIEPGVAPDIHW